MIKRIFSLALLLVLLMTGCKVESKTWIDEMLSEMEMAWVRADKAKKGNEGRNEAVSLVAQKYFSPGMSRAEAHKLLSDLKLQKFHIGEYRHEEARKWPEGEFKPYITRKISPGVSSFSIRKDYGRERGIITKFVSISFVINDTDDRIMCVEARLQTSAL